MAYSPVQQQHDVLWIRFPSLERMCVCIVSQWTPSARRIPSPVGFKLKGNTTNLMTLRSTMEVPLMQF